ncbi:MAG: bifunctional UDP-N-acetylmuramoyl-tripeptide:D-alanyl-D-alanine ligase/alanine racemase [Saprospiraceae bacterium]|nr:bifunctional UDP-N-acetylmuramoyl-tripeptide:D-alanyl-D-alanine ligase/alanine racemase [Saprospiraceae bacterium]
MNVISYTLAELVKIVNATQVVFDDKSNDLQDIYINEIYIDSRNIFFTKQSLFFAIRGNRYDGHQFINQLYAKGLRYFIVESVNIQEVRHDFPDAVFIKVENTVIALQAFAAYHRHRFDIPIVGITGSNGKTVVKEWLAQLLHQNFNIVRSPKSYNSQIGVPLSVLQIQPTHQLGIFEAGISKPSEMKAIANIIDCQYGIFTNIGAAHSEGFNTIEEKIKEKFDLFTNCKYLVYHSDNELINDTVAKYFKGIKIDWSYSDKNAFLFINKVSKFDNQRTRIDAIFNDESIFIEILFSDEASVENAIHCWALTLLLKLPFTDIQKRFLELEPVEMRLEVKKGVNNTVIINDAYNSDLNSIAIALNYLANQQSANIRTVIMSDILQSGMSTQDLYYEVARLLIERKINKFVGIGEEIRQISAFLETDIKLFFFKDADEFLKNIHTLNFGNEYILLKGARPFQFERIAHRLELKIHKTTLEVNLSAIRNNLHTYLQFLQPNTAIMVMIKASGYGSGSVEVAKMLCQQSVDYLAVAYADEGIELREAGIDLPILVLNPEESSFDAMIRFNLEPEIYSKTLLLAYLSHTKNHHTQSHIHIKLDTGMHRLGFEEHQLPELLEILSENKQVKVKSIFSHLAASEADEHREFTHLQAQRFMMMCDVISQKLGYMPMRHIVNSAGISRFPEYQFEMVRLGIGLYGIDGNEEIRNKLQVVNTLKATISQIKHILPHETIGYGRKGIVDTPKTIATISIGYADGFLRKLSDVGFSVNIKGKKAPIIGTVCMDMTMVDVSHIDDVAEGDEVIIFGEFPLVEDLAKNLGTIPYEIFSIISSRVSRVYFWE